LPPLTALHRARLPVAAAFVFLSATHVPALAVPSPAAVSDSTTRYVIYLHGAILESHGAGAVHPRFGAYEYAAILDSLGARGVVVLSELREENADGEAYSHTVSATVDSLLSAGVPPENVTVIGFSKGGGIAMRACTLIMNESVNYVFMACCPRNMTSWPERKYMGRILAIHETSDTFAGSCRSAILGSSEEDDVAGITYEELEIDTGLEHGAFYRPLGEWLEPALEWAFCRDLTRGARVNQ